MWTVVPFVAGLYARVIEGLASKSLPPVRKEARSGLEKGEEHEFRPVGKT